MDKLKSRKLWVTIVSAVLMVANQGIGLKLPEDTILSFAGVVMSYIFCQSIVDAKQQSVLPISHALIQPASDESAASQVIQDNTNKKEEAPKQAQVQELVQAQVVEPPQPVVDPNQEKINKITEIQQQIDQLKSELVPAAVSPTPSVIINQ